MASNITRSEIDKYRSILKRAEPYADDEMSVLDRDVDGERRQATFAKNILEYYGLSLTDEGDYGNIE